MKPVSLKELQRELSDAISGAPLSDSVAPLIRESSAFTRAQRLEVYRFAFQARMIESLEDDFPLTCHFVGKSGFDELVLAYVQKMPSTFASIAEISRGFPEFLAVSPSVSSLGRSIAHYEWLLVETTNAWIPSESAVSGLAQMDPNQRAQAKLELAPGVRLFESRWAVDSIDADSFELPPEKRTFLAIYPVGSGVRSERLSEVEWNALSALRVPTSAETVGEVLESLDIALSEAAQMFANWSRENLIALVSETKKKEE